MSQVLVVDDNPTNLKLARVVLRLAGHEVQTAASAEEALALLETRRPALILMDVQLPGTDGLTLTRRLKADRRMAGMKIVALTAYAMKPDEAAAFAAGCDGYIAKPIDVDRFAAQLQSFLPPAESAS